MQQFGLRDYCYLFIQGFPAEMQYEDNPWLCAPLCDIGSTLGMSLNDWLLVLGAMARLKTFTDPNFLVTTSSQRSVSRQFGLPGSQ